MARWWRYLLLLALLLAPRPAAAETDQELAKRYYKLGETLYHRSEFEGALKQFKRSYEYSNKPALLFNIARCHESLGQHEEAIAAYEKYLEANPSEADNIRARIKNLRRLLEKKQQDKAVEPAPTGPTPAPADVPPAAQPDPVEPPSDEAPTDEGPRTLRLAGWILAGSGVALVVTGVALGLVARSKASDLESANKAGEEFADHEDTYNQGKTMEGAAIGTLVVGGLAAAAGAVLVVLDWRAQRKKRQAWIAPLLSAEVGGISAGLRF